MATQADAQKDNAQQENATACYVYGVVPADVQVHKDARGVGDPPGRVKVVRDDGIAALVSEIRLGHPLGTPDDLVAHQQLLDAAAAQAPVLPMRFGAVMTSPDAVADELLGAHHDEFANALAELEGKAEYLVRGRYVQESVLAEILDQEPEAGRLAQEIRGMDENATRNQRIRLGELISNAIGAWREKDTQELLKALEPYCSASSVLEPTHEEDAAHVALLAELSRQGDLEHAVGEIAGQWAGRIDLRLLGPLAPYDFVMSATPASAAPARES